MAKRATIIFNPMSGRPWVEVDGELLGPPPMTFEVVPDALSLIVP